MIVSSDRASLPWHPLFRAAHENITERRSNPSAISDGHSKRTFTYTELLLHTSSLKERILDLFDMDDLKEQRIVTLFPNGYDYVVAQWAVWAAGGICVPLCMFS